MSRTAVSPAEALWTHRGKVALVAVLFLVVTPALTYLLAHAISRPVRALRASAESAAGGGELAPLVATRLTPRELVALGHAIERMHEQLSERAQYILEFATQVSHELKTPITAISGAVELLREQADDMSEAQRERFLGNMASDAERMDRLVRRLLLLARIESARDVPEAIESIDVAAALEHLRARAPERIRLDVEPGLPPLAMPSDHFETALGNLIDNALRHGEGQPIEIRARRARGVPRMPEAGAPLADALLLEVHDRGLGVAAAHRGRIFERFYTTQRDRGGTGLGLALVRAVAETHGGRVELESEPGATCFRLVLFL